MILGGENRHGTTAVAQREERYLRADHALFEHHAGAGVAEAPLVHRMVNRAARFVGIRGNDDTLARGEAVHFDHYREAEFS